jgi:hypothetical protein
VGDGDVCSIEDDIEVLLSFGNEDDDDDDDDVESFFSNGS